MSAQRACVLQLIYGFGLESYGGGAERFVFGLSRALDPDRFRVMVGALWSLGTDSEKKNIAALQAAGVDAFSLAKWEEGRETSSFLSSLGALHRVLRRTTVDILHSHSQFADIAALVEGLAFPRLRIVRTPHDGHHVEWRSRPWRRFAFTRLLYPLRYNAEIGVSSAVVDRLDRRPLAKRLRRRAIHIPNAVDLSRFSTVSVSPKDKRRELGVPIDAFVVGTIGRLAPEKGYDLLIEAARLVLAELPHTHFIVVGDGELADDLKIRVRDLGLSASFHFTGARSDVEEILRCFDVFVSSSRWEGLSTVILESIASGVPVVATAVGGTSELLEDGLSGWLVPTVESGPIAASLLRAYEERRSWSDMVSRATRKLAVYSIDSVAREHENLYGTLLHE